MGIEQPKILKPEEQALIEKEGQWKRKLAEFKAPDCYDYVIDEGVRETVAALQLLGFNTTQSDQGNHFYTPWVQVEAEEPKDIYIGEPETKAELMAKFGILPDEIDQRSTSFNRAKQVDIEEGAREQLACAGTGYTAEYEQWHKDTLELAKRLQDIIENFYKTQATPEGLEDLRISLKFPYRFPQYATYIQDIPFLQVELVGKEAPIDFSGNEYQELLIRCQSEMRRFTEFLKERFLIA